MSLSGCLNSRPPFTGLRSQSHAQACALLAPRQRPAQGWGAQLRVSASVVAEPATLEVKTFEGEVQGSETLALRVADPEVARGLVHRYVVLIQQNARAGTASTKTRAEVRGGGRKPYAQKGTGQARQGSKRTPLRPGGGVVFGPRPVDWTIKMNKKERRLALATALQSAASCITVISGEGWPAGEIVPKTRVLAQALARWGVGPREHALLICLDPSEALVLSARNIPTLQLNTIEGLCAYDVLRADKILVEADALAVIQGFLGPYAPALDEEEEDEGEGEGGAEAADAPAEEPAAAPEATAPEAEG